jgi:hypothetical protein
LRVFNRSATFEELPGAQMTCRRPQNAETSELLLYLQLLMDVLVHHRLLNLRSRPDWDALKIPA